MKAEEIIDKITEQLTILNEQPLEDFSGDTLSRTGVRLAAYKAGLGKYFTEAKKDTLRAEKAYKEAKANAYKKLRAEGQGDGAAKNLTILLVGDEYNDYIEAQILEDQISNLVFNVHDLIDAIKSRVINCQMERQESKVF